MTDEVNKQGILNIGFLYSGIIIGLANTVLKARVLTPQEIGLLAIIASISSVTVYPICFGIPSGILKYYARFKKNPRQKSGFLLMCLLSMLILFALVSAGFYIFQDKIASFYDNELLDRYIKFVYFFFFFNSIDIAFDAVFRSEYLTVKGNLIGGVSEKFFHCVFLVIMFIFDIGFHAFFIYTIVTVFMKFSLFMFFMFRDMDLATPSFSFLEKEFTTPFFSYSFFMFFSGVAGVITSAADSLMLGHFINLHVVGIYSIAMTFPRLLVVAGKGYGTIAVPKMAEHMENRDWGEVERLYKENLSSQLFLALLLFILFFVFGEALLGFFGEEYVPGFNVLVFLCLGELFNTGTGLCGTIIAFSKYYRLDLILRFTLMALAVTTNLVLIPKWGLTGAGIATALSLAMYNLIKVFYVYFRFKITPYGLETLYTILFAGIFGIGVFLLQRYFVVSHIVAIMCLSATYAVVYLLLAARLLKLAPAILLMDTIKTILRIR